MECREVQGVLEEFRRDALPERERQEVRAHLDRCPRCRALNEADLVLGRVLRQTLPRHAVPPALRGGILRAAGRGRRGFALLSNPWVSAGIAAGLTLILVLPFLVRGRGSDPMQALTAEVMGEHLRTVLSEERGEAESHEVLVEQLRAKTGVALRWYYGGDPEVKLISVRPALVMGKKAVGLVYQDRTGHMATYLVFPDERITVPASGRVQIEDYKPYWGKADAYSLFFWKHEGLNCVLVSDWERERFLQLFLKVRRASDPPPL